MTQRYTSNNCAFMILTRGQGREREILLHLRENTGYMDGMYDFSASGHLEPGESLQTCAIRETAEEIGVTLDPAAVRLVFISHNITENYIRTIFAAELPIDATPRVCEPEKSGGLLWAKPTELPENIEPFIPKILAALRLGLNYDDGTFTNLKRLQSQPSSAGHSQSPREIHKKISSEYFDLIASGQKTFEYRVNDFDCQPGDTLVLEEWIYDGGYGDTEHRYPTGRTLRRKAGYVGKTSAFDWLDRPDVRAALEQHGTQIISLLDE